MEEKKLTQDKRQTKDSSKEENLLELLGIKLEDGKLEIDTNQTKEFFENLQKSIEKKAEDLSSGNINLENVGIKVKDEKIEVDLNKTKSLLDNIAKKAKNFVDILDKTINDISKK